MELSSYMAVLGGTGHYEAQHHEASYGCRLDLGVTGDEGSRFGSYGRRGLGEKQEGGILASAGRDSNAWLIGIPPIERTRSGFPSRCVV